MTNPTDTYFKLILALLFEKQRKLQAAYFASILKVARFAAVERSKGKTFSLANYPRLKQTIDAQVKKLNDKVHIEVVNGIDRAWSLSDDKNKVFVDQALKGLELSPKAKKIYYDSHIGAKESFLKQRIAGLDISDRVWNTTDQFRNELEIGVQQGITTGESARDMAKRMQKYLLVPDNRFRDVEDEALRKELIRKAAKNHPGQGVYRSSYKNALRLTRDQINRAYRTADQERWQGQSFVVGIRISLSNGHPLKPENEICEQLAGDYPKDYIWRGNHVACMCHATPILISAKERTEMRAALMNGEQWSGKSENEVTDVPENFKNWIRDNAERIAGLKSVPDIIKLNEKYIPKGAIKKLK
jgi:hypothetical protein